MKTTKLLLRAVGLAAILLSANARAQQLTATLVEISPEMPVYGTVDGSFYQEWASGVADFGDFQGFCVEPLQGLNYGETVIYQVQDAGNLNNSDVVARLIGGYLALPEKTAEDAAAIQWAIWEATTETSLSEMPLLAGNVLITSPNATALLANQYLANVANFTPATLTLLSNSERQDVVTWTVVPEPGVSVLAMLSAFALLRRRR